MVQKDRKILQFKVPEFYLVYIGQCTYKTYYAEVPAGSGRQATAAKNVNLVHVYFFLYKMYQAT